MYDGNLTVIGRKVLSDMRMAYLKVCCGCYSVANWTDWFNTKVNQNPDLCSAEIEKLKEELCEMILAKNSYE